MHSTECAIYPSNISNMIIGTLLIQLLGTETSGRCFWEQSTEIGMTTKNKMPFFIANGNHYFWALIPSRDESFSKLRQRFYLGASDKIQKVRFDSVRTYARVAS